MKNLKSTLFIVLLVIFVLVCGFMLGRIDFNAKETNEDNQYVTEDGDVVTDNNDNELQELSSKEFMTKFVGKYSYESLENEGKVCNTDCNNNVKLELKNDGTYNFSYVYCCGGGYFAKGNYAISENKIYLFNDDCKPVDVGNECAYPNCSPLKELDYTLIDGVLKIMYGNIELVKE